MAEVFRFRIALIFLVFGLGLTALAARLGYLQLGLHREMAGRARSLVTGLERLPAPRGRSLARDGSLLALDRPVYDLHVYVPAPLPARLGGPAGLARELEDALQPDRRLAPSERALLLERLEAAHALAVERRAGAEVRARDLTLARGLSSAEALARLRDPKFRKRWLPLNMTLEPLFERAYPLGSGGGPAVGGIFPTARGMHHLGLERLFQDGMPLQPGAPVPRLLGKAGIFGRYLLGPPIQPEPPGAVRTTLDPVLQVRLTRILAEEAARVKPEWAAALLMDPRTGELLALASWPTFDPNRGRDLEVSPVAGRRNHCIESRFEPGSTMKPLIVAAALEERVVRPDELIDCGWNGPDGLYLRPPGRGKARRVQDDHRMVPAVVPLPRVLIESSNIGAVKIGLRLGAQKYVSWLRRFGLDRPAGLGLAGEVDPYFEQAEKMLRNEASFQRGTGPSLSQGYAITFNLVRLAAAYCPLANGGLLVQPRLIQALDLPGKGTALFESGPGERILAPETAETLRSFLAQVVSDEHGTAYRMAGAEGRGVIAGKTGTARVTNKNNYWAFFVGFAPACSPRYLAAAVFYKEDTYRFYGAANAGPTVRDALLGALAVDEAAP